jgi:hypothetical protein
MMLTTDEVVAEYKSLAGHLRRTSGNNGYLYPFAVDEKHTDKEGDDWYIITAFVNSLDRWLLKQCDINEEYCGTAYPHQKYSDYPRYNVHGSLLTIISLRWL